MRVNNLMHKFIDLVDCLCYDLNYEMEGQHIPSFISYKIYGYLESSTFRMAKRVFLSEIFNDEYTK